MSAFNLLLFLRHIGPNTVRIECLHIVPIYFGCLRIDLEPFLLSDREPMSHVSVGI